LQLSDQGQDENFFNSLSHVKDVLRGYLLGKYFRYEWVVYSIHAAEWSVIDKLRKKLLFLMLGATTSGAGYESERPRSCKNIKRGRSFLVWTVTLGLSQSLILIVNVFWYRWQKSNPLKFVSLRGVSANL